MQRNSKKSISTVIAVLCLALNLLAQTKGQFSYVTESPTPLIKVFEDLKNNIGLDFSYPSELINNYTLEKSSHQSNNLNDFIKSVLSFTDLEFKIIDRRKILIRPRRSPIVENYTSSNSIIIKGLVKGNNGEALSFVDVVLDTLNIGTSTDDSGSFELKIPNSLVTRKLSFHLIGYANPKIEIQTFLKNPTIQLRAESLNLQELLFIEKIPSISISPIPFKSSIKADYLKGMITPFLSNDIVRGIQMMAGVSATNDASAEVRIRGSQGDETLIMLDGIPIYKADHFYGIFGAINGNHVNKVSLHKNNMPLQYGGKTGGMLEMASSDYFNETKGLLDFNMLTSSATISAPIGDKFGFIVSGRTTYDNAADSKLFNWIEPSNEEELLNSNIQSSNRPLLLYTNPVIQFYDWNSKLVYNPNQQHAISFNLFGSRDDYSNIYDIAYENQRTNVTVKAQEDFNDVETSENFGASIRYSGKLKNNWSINSTLYHSAYNFSGQLTSSLSITNTGTPLVAVLTNEKENNISDFGGYLSLSKKLKKDKVTLGMSAVYHDIDFTFSADNNRRFDTNPTGEEAAIFGTYDWAPANNWNIALSSRLDYYSGTKEIYFGPRISTSYRLNNKFSLKASYAQNYQFLREVTLYTRLREPIDIFLLTSERGARKYPVGSTQNWMMGMTLVDSEWSLDLELYHKATDGVIEQTEVVLGSNPDENKPAPRVYKTVIGDGTMIGMDLTVGYEKEQYESWLAYTLSKATNRFDELFQGADIPSPDDRRHQLKWANFYNLGDWRLTGSYVFASGISQISLLDREDVLDITETPQPNTYARLDPYHRVDLGIDYNFKLGGSKASIGIGVFNLTNNRNVNYIQYLFSPIRKRNDQNKSVLTGTTTQLLDRTFNLNFKLDW